MGMQKDKKTINSRYSLVITHPTTNRPTHGFSMAEQTGSPVVHVLWSIAKTSTCKQNMTLSAVPKSQACLSREDIIISTLRTKRTIAGGRSQALERVVQNEGLR
jgi:hypothetical protein